MTRMGRKERVTVIFLRTAEALTILTTVLIGIGCWRSGHKDFECGIERITGNVLNEERAECFKFFCGDKAAKAFAEGEMRGHEWIDSMGEMG